MCRNIILIWLLINWLVILSSCWQHVARNDQDSPNILLMMVDDMGYSDIGCYGGEIPTPNIDQLANEGLRMTSFYNAARCCPSRASLLTGMYPHLAGMGHQNQDRGHPSYRGRIKDSANTLAQILKAHGYATYHVGKWHVGGQEGYRPPDKGFENYFSLIEGAMNYYNQWPWLKRQDSLEITYNGEKYQTPPNFYATRSFADTAAAWIDQHSPEQPFFMYLAFNAPHWPLHAPQKTINKYIGKYEMGWDTVRQQRLRNLKKMGLIGKDVSLPDRFHQIPAWAELPKDERVHWDKKMALYAAVMDELDAGIGTVVQTVELHDHPTLIIFLSDNGGCHENPVPGEASWVSHPLDGRPGGPRSFPSYGVPWAHVSNTPFRLFKSYVHEGGIATPLIVRYSGVVPEGHLDISTVGHIMDIAPTLLEAAGIPGAMNPDQLPMTGMSLWKVWLGTPQAREDTLYWEHQHNRAVRAGNWKLVSVYKNMGEKGMQDQWELYNLEKDPTESNDLAIEHPETVAQLSRSWDLWAAQVGVLPPEIK